ncbi:hypothetical protein C8R43DRAFT_947643 [Mycena crocata]|nr:hypothetical protein C8R43DRAFT_947643 [Mycena crocata]
MSTQNFDLRGSAYIPRLNKIETGFEHVFICVVIVPVDQEYKFHEFDILLSLIPWELTVPERGVADDGTSTAEVHQQVQLCEGVQMLTYGSASGTTMPPTQGGTEDAKETRLARNRQAAREYRARNRNAINEKARQRMQKARSLVKSAPDFEQAAHQDRNRAYSATYRARHTASIRVRARIRTLRKKRQEHQRRKQEQLGR